MAAPNCFFFTPFCLLHPILPSQKFNQRTLLSIPQMIHFLSSLQAFTRSRLLRILHVSHPTHLDLIWHLPILQVLSKAETKLSDHQVQFHVPSSGAHRELHFSALVINRWSHITNFYQWNMIRSDMCHVQHEAFEASAWFSCLLASLLANSEPQFKKAEP